MSNPWSAAGPGGPVLTADREVWKRNRIPGRIVVNRFVLLCTTALGLGLSQANSARAGLIYNGSTGGIAFGVTGYGPPVPGVPTYINNTFTGLNDILSSPGGTFGTANPVVANNTTTIGPIPFVALHGFQVGGGNVNGPFGAGAATIFGPAAAFALSDATVGGGGSASYGIESWKSSFTEVGNYVGTFGTYLSIGGNLPTVGSSAIASLTTEVSFTLAGVTKTYDLYPIVLAMGNAGGTNTWVASGGGSTVGPGIIVPSVGGGWAWSFNAATGNYAMLGVDDYAANIPNGTQINVTSTITFYADPASIDSILPLSSYDDSNLSGGLPGISFGGSAVPEPRSMVMSGTALVLLSILGWMRHRRAKAVA